MKHTGLFLSEGCLPFPEASVKPASWRTGRNDFSIQSKQAVLFMGALFAYVSNGSEFAIFTTRISRAPQGGQAKGEWGEGAASPTRHPFLLPGNGVWYQ